MKLTTGGMYKHIVMQNAATGTGNGTAVIVTDNADGAHSTLTCQITGINGDTITWEATIDDTNWIAIPFTNLNTASAATTATANGLYRATVSGLSQVRARVSTYSAGTIVVKGMLTA